LVGSIVDSAKVGDKTYSNKAPATAIISTPFYAILRLFIDEPNPSNIRISWDILRILISSVPLFLLGLWLWKREVSTFSLAVLLFATPLFSYSLIYFSHVFTAVLIYIAFRLLFDKTQTVEESDVDKSPRKLTIISKFPMLSFLIAGLLSGIVVLSEFPAAIAVFVFFVFLALQKSNDKSKNLGFFVLGGVPALVCLLAYNNSLFGSPFSFSYGNEAFGEWAAVANQGILGISFPTPEKIWTSFLSPSRGLFFYAPILVLSIFLFFKTKEKTQTRQRVAFWASIATLIILAGHGAPHGGWGMSARYAIIVVPLMLDSFFRGEDSRFDELWKGLLFAVSFLLCAIPILSFPFAPPEFSFPHNDFWRANLINEGWFTPTLLGGSLLALLPVVVALASVLGVVWLSSKNRQRFGVGTLVGITLVGIYIFLPNLENRGDSQFRRATIAERFYKPANRLDEFKKDALSRNDWKAVQNINSYNWIINDARAFAPNDFPYLESQALNGSPTAILKKMLVLQKQGKTAEAEQLLMRSKTDFPFATCELSTNLAVIYYSTNRKDQALSELESVQTIVNKGSLPDCTRSQYLLGNLYKELNRNEDSAKMFANYLVNTESVIDKETISNRKTASQFLSK
jgi:hypothetical protein